MTITLTRITLENIRSYRDPVTIDFPQGSILFQGDIGCGKSTVLSGIEFALFGLGDIDGKHLLRSGEKRGSVALEFRSNAKEYSVFRTLARKSKNVVQADGYIIEEGMKTDYAVGEMKSRILEIININERPQAKTTSLLYRFAIFTPQEMMKQVISESADRRLQILRRAFGIEEYSTAQTNVNEVALDWLKGEIKVSKALAEDLPQKRKLLSDEQTKITEINEEITRLSTEGKAVKVSIDKLHDKIEKLETKKDALITIQESIPRLKSKIQQSQKQIRQAEETLRQLQKDLDSIEIAERTLRAIKPDYDAYSEKKSKLVGLSNAIKTFNRLEKENIGLKKDILSEEKRIRKEIQRLEDEIRVDVTEIQQEKTMLLGLDGLQSKETAYLSELESLPVIRKELQEVVSSISKTESDRSFLLLQLRQKKAEIDQILAIGVGAPCPKCKQQLTREHIATAESEFIKEKTDSDKKILHLDEILNGSNRRKQEIDTQIALREDAQKQLEQLRKTISSLIQKKESLQTKEQKMKDKQELLDEQRDIVIKADYCQDERKRLSEVTSEMDNLQESVSLYENMQLEIEKYENNKIEARYAEALQETNRRPRVVTDTQKTKDAIRDLQDSVDLDSKELTDNETRLDKDSAVFELLKQLQKDKLKLDDTFMQNEKVIAGKRSQLTLSRVEELEEEVLHKEEQYRKCIFDMQSKLWINECLVPAINDIEQHVLATINDEFNQLFQRWFNLLIESGDISVEVDEHFAPLITQGGYELPVDSLSGGEKTSVALAYRLALNTMVKRVASMQSSLLILDEPTDGFSREQLIRLRQVLEELDTSQIIMVSHERELESFVDNIYRVSKENGISKVESIKA